MNKWKNGNASLQADDKNLGLLSQTFKRLYHTVIKNTRPVAMVFPAVWPGAPYILLSLSFLNCNRVTTSLTCWDIR